MSKLPSQDNFNMLKGKVRDAGLLRRVPIRGSLEMIAIIISICMIFVLVYQWDIFALDSFFSPFALGLFMTIVWTRTVFVSHDILHLLGKSDEK